MQGRIYRELGPIKARQRGMALLRSAAWGLLASSAVGIGVSVYQRYLGVGLNPRLATAAIALLAGPLLGALFALARGRGWHQAAAAVDAHYHLKDRTATALEFVARPHEAAIRELQVQDAVEHLATIEPKAVVPYRMPRALPWAALLLAACALVGALPLAPTPAKAGPAAPREHIVAAADDYLSENNLKEIDELAKAERDPKIEKLIEQLRQKVEEMKQAGVDEREAMATISEMQAAIAQEQAQLNTGLVDGQLQSLGNAMTPASALEAAGQALAEAKFDKAAEELEKLETADIELDRKEAKAVEEKLKQVAEEAGEAGLGQLGEAAGELAEGVKGGGQSGKFKKATKDLAKQTKSHARRRKIKKLLEQELDKLAEAKNKCNYNSMVKGKQKQKSTSPSSNFGMTTSGNELGEKTSMLSKREIKEITGEEGDGASEMETTHTPEGRQTAARGYKDAYKKAMKATEAVLDSEPIPLGHRQTIRRYFESIRPSNGDDPKDAKPAPAKESSVPAAE